VDLPGATTTRSTGTVTSPAPARGVPTGVRRKPERSPADRALLDHVLDTVLAGSLCTVVDGEPWVVPMLFARDGDRVLLHGSTGAGALRHVADGAPAALSVVSVDGMVVAHTTFESSANYRSAVVRGRLTPLSGDDQWDALDRLSDRLVPGRTSEVRPMLRKEIAATLCMALPIVDGGWTVKVRTGPPGVPDEPTDAWCGVVPFRLVAGEPEPAPWVAPGAPVPESVRRLVSAEPA
jgi:nitroimidazol reductase NimA-like FMN-containing flavoprotein (pyridoxamine 5'-phosphate oxidase superfamily)